MTDATVYELFGARVRTTLRLPCPATEADPDVCVSVGEPTPIGSDPAPGDLLADKVDGWGRRWYSLSRQPDADVLRIPTVCDLLIARGGGSAHFVPNPGRDREMLSIVLTGTGIAAMLALAGRLVLHGSAVVRDGTAVAFLGDSGQGKSTMTSLSCIAGWQLLCDDVLRIDVDDGVARCHPGGYEIRLRTNAPRDTAWPSRTTVDERCAVSPPNHPHLASLGGLVIPFPDRATTRIKARRLDGSDAVSRLMYFGRITGWRDKPMIRRLFMASAELAGSVAVWEVDVPWEDRLVPGLVDEIVETVLTAAS